ncbi:N-acyl-D-amino-acid deacylase family protein [Hyalangium rubrum]|uniref:Amidohydrolase family protein n=1 Tax=Hyalangium rubrum TaxID=3103134 RepID=A0ABU5H2X7_9BACT|nr:amidohydrolase family protein [Hyalangium sp. s54d21]MDY7227807.1 amidohydrolase family protein [Hyalangium sp. s54d21]
MLDLLLEGGTVIDGTGAEPRTADVGIRDGRIVEVGRITEAARERVDATGAWVTPGFIDIHTHYDGQASWDETFSPSIHHGVTTVMMGNCGVGFAPVRPGGQQRLIHLMEGVEDIPGAVLAEGVRWDWESFPRYMEALAAIPHSLDFLAQVPHDPLRIYVMGERAAAKEAATPEDIAAMRGLLRAALEAGAAGFSTGRTDNHRTAEGLETPASEASAAELVGLAQAFQGLSHGVVQVVSDFDLLRDPGRFGAEFDLVEQLAGASGRPLSMTWLQRDPGGEQYEAMRTRVEAAVTRGLPLYLQAAARGIGVLLGLDASFHPFIGFPGYKELAALPVAERAAALREPARRARILAEQPERLAGDGTPIPPLVDILLRSIERISARMFPLGDRLNYEPTLADSFLMLAKRSGQPVLAVLYDYLCAGDGSNLIYFPIFNYNSGSLDVVRRMLDHPRVLAGLSDAGAHVGTVCDASFSTFLLTYWSRDRGSERLPLERSIELMTSRNARYLGLSDRGTIAPGLRADLNLIDPRRLALRRPELRRDLPVGGKRFVQTADGYLATFVAGQAVQRDGVVTPERPGRLVRLGHSK